MRNFCYIMAVFIYLFFNYFGFCTFYWPHKLV